MTVEANIFAALKGLVANRVYPDVAKGKPAFPYITYTQVGGKAVNFVGPDVPSKKNARFQFNIWGSSRAQVYTLARQVEDALRVATSLQTTVLGAPVASYEAEMDLYGSRQDFSFWHTD